MKHILQLSVVVALLLLVWSGSATKPAFYGTVVNLPELSVFPVDSPEVDLPFPFQDNVNPYGDPGRITLTDPSNMNNVIEYDPDQGKYYFYKRIGDRIDYRNPTVLN